MAPLLVSVDTLSASHGGHEQYVDGTGTAWILSTLEGWHATPPRRTVHAERATADGAYRSAAYRQTRTIELAGRFFPPSFAVGWSRSELVTALCPDPGVRYPLSVQDPNRTLVAYVEQAGDILCAPLGPLVWDWSVPLVAADPYRYAQAWLTSGAAPGTQDPQVVFKLAGPTGEIQIADPGRPGIVGVRGEVYAGEVMYINTSPRTAFGVPGASAPIPGYGAILGLSNARSAVWIGSGGWPRVGVGQVPAFAVTGSTGSGWSLTTYTRGVWI